MARFTAAGAFSGAHAMLPRRQAFSPGTVGPETGNSAASAEAARSTRNDITKWIVRKAIFIAVSRWSGKPPIPIAESPRNSSGIKAARATALVRFDRVTFGTQAEPG